MSLVKGGGDRGNFVEVSCVPASAFKTEIDALIAAGTQVTGKLVTLSLGVNYEVDSADAGDIPDGKIIDYEKTASTYRLTVRLFSYVDAFGVRHTPTNIVNLYYGTGTMALGDAIKVNGSAYISVVDAGTSAAGDGWGLVIAKDVPASTFVDVLF